MTENKKYNPYLAGRQAWAEIYGPITDDRDWWRKAFFISLIICLVSISGNVLQITQLLLYLIRLIVGNGYVQILRY